MFQKSSGKPVMYRLRGRMSLEITDKCLVFYKIMIQYLSQILVVYFLNVSKQFLIHAICTFLCCRHIIGRDVFAFLHLSDLLDIHLQIIVIADDLTIYLNEIQLVIVCDPTGIRIPHFSVQCSGLILKDQIIIRPSVSGLRRTLSFTQIYISDRFPFVKGIDISHLISSFYILYLYFTTAPAPKHPSGRLFLTSDCHVKGNVHITTGSLSLSFESDLTAAFLVPQYTLVG